MNTRHYAVQMAYNGMPATEEMKPYFNGFTYTDSIDESDTVSITLLDRKGKWASGWIPRKEDLLKPEILLENWMTSGEKRTIVCGEFLVDDFEFSGPPDKLIINGISSPINTDFKENRCSKTWKDVTLRQVGEEIAGKYGMTLCFEGKDIKISKMEQSRQPDAEFLKQLAEKYGFALKVYSGRLVLFEWEGYEGKPSKGIIKKDQVRRWQYHSSMLGTYTGAKVSYTDPNTKETIAVMVGKEGRIYSSTEKADSPADAERIGRNAIRNANRKETTVSIIMNPEVFFFVSDNVELRGFGKADGRYQIGKITHQISAKDYTVQISAWRLLETGEEKQEADPSSKGDSRYVVKKNDTLWDLAIQFYGDGDKCSFIYEANREVIEAAARSRGKASSSSGYWIYEGTELTIP